MIIKKFLTGLSMPFNMLAAKTEAIAISVPTPVDRGDFCWCSRVCPPQMVVFAGTSDLTTDKSSFIYPAATGADPFKVELFKNGAKVADLNNQTYGEYFVFVTNDGNFAHGVVLNWGSVYAAFGSGSYEVIAEVITVGQTIDYNSGEFNLIPFSEEAADQTVRIETWQNGRIESSPIDFTGLNWYSQIRLEGTMKERVPELVSSNYKDSLRNIKQIQDSVLDTWTLELFELTGAQKNALIYEALLSNRIVVTDYSLDNDERYTAQEVVGDVIEAVNYRINEPGNSVVLKLKSRKEDILKRNTIFDTVALGGGGANVCPNAYVTLGGLPYLELFAGQTVNIFVLNSDGQAVSANVSGNNLTLPDVPISVNGSNEGDLVAQNPVSVNLSDGTNPITPDAVSLVGNTLGITILPPFFGFEPEYRKVLLVAQGMGMTLPSSGVQILQNQLVIDLKSSGAWAKDDILYVMAQDGSAEFACLNWKNPISNSLRRVNAITFVPNQGLAGDGVSAYLDTRFDPSVDGVNYTLNNASRYFYLYDSTVKPNNFMDGIAVGQANRMQVVNPPATTGSNQINGGTSTAYAYGDNREMKSIHRPDSANIAKVKAKVVTMDANASTSVQSNHQCILRASGGYGQHTVSFYSMGASQLAENDDKVDAFDNYINAL